MSEPQDQHKREIANFYESYAYIAKIYVEAWLAGEGHIEIDIRDEPAPKRAIVTGGPTKRFPK